MCLPSAGTLHASVVDQQDMQTRPINSWTKNPVGGLNNCNKSVAAEIGGTNEVALGPPPSAVWLLLSGVSSLVVLSRKRGAV